MAENANPTIQPKSETRTELVLRDGRLQNVSADSVFELIRDIVDPEHPYTLEQLKVVSREDIVVGSVLHGKNDNSDDNIHTDCICRKGLPLEYVAVTFTPTVPHCSMAGIIGLSIRRQLERHIPDRWIRVLVKEGTHTSDTALNKQLNDKDRVMAAFENSDLLDILDSNIKAIGE